MRASIFITGLLSVAGTSLASSLEIFEQLRDVPKGWSQYGIPSPEKRMKFRIALQQPNKELFQQTLLAVSTPNNPKYGQHLKRDELKTLLKPSDESTEAVLTWLQQSGIAEKNIINDGEWINFWASISQAESMMNTEFYIYKDFAHNVTKTRTLQYSVPEDVSEHITMIQPTTRFGQIKAQRSNLFEVLDGPKLEDIAQAPAVPTLDVAASCNTSITPACIRALYNIGDYYATPSNNSLFGVCGYLEEYAKFDNLAVFLEKYAPYAEGQNFSYVLINGGLNNQTDSVDDDGEANLDIQYAASISYKTPITYYSTGGLGELDPDNDQPDPSDNENEPYLDFLTYIVSVSDDELPQTITTSYGEDEQSVPYSYAENVCNLFGQLGARGVSILFSSGDGGVGSACETNDGTNTTRFNPQFPAACPYVTSVGATYQFDPEVSVSFSGGGFSDYWARPSWQDDAVSTYFGILGDRWEGLYNASGRGFPDVAAQGVRFHVIEKDYSSGEYEDDEYSGTSASSPTFAAVISLLNNALLAAGKPPLGYLNPWIYSVGKNGLNDITHGGSTGCTGTDSYTGLPVPYVPYASWNATTGWDPVSGNGTPDFAKLLALVLNGTETPSWNGTAGYW